jgi:signal transduction histidine kinase
MMRARERVSALLQARRPVLRVQLALLYTAVFVGLVVVLLLASSVLFGTRNVLFAHSQLAYHGGSRTAAQGSVTHSFQAGPFLIVLAAVALAVLAAWWLAGRFLRPLRAMTSAAQEISATNLGRRLNLEGPDDELTDLGRTLDHLFGRLQTSFDSQRQFVANASHELRTPLAGQRTLLQVALADPHADTKALRATCEEALELSVQQERLIDGLLTLATSERGIERWEHFDLGTLAQAVVDARRQEAERRGIRIESSFEPAAAVGDVSLVESLVTNLVENAIRHNVNGGLVEVGTDVTAGGARLSVRNTGPAVPSVGLEQLFEPFQRLGGQRLRPSDGHGLGLAIVQAVATAHQATLVARPCTEGGLDVNVTFRASH